MVYTPSPHTYNAIVYSASVACGFFFVLTKSVQYRRNTVRVTQSSDRVKLEIKYTLVRNRQRTSAESTSNKTIITITVRFFVPFATCFTQNQDGCRKLDDLIWKWRRFSVDSEDLNYTVRAVIVYAAGTRDRRNKLKSQTQMNRSLFLLTADIVQNII